MSHQRVVAIAAGVFLAILGAGYSGASTSVLSGSRSQAANLADSSAGIDLSQLGSSKGPTLPKVPFGNRPCQSLSASDQMSLGFSSTPGKPDRAPGTLPFDNLCF